jgi:hypothetical protein
MGLGGLLVSLYGFCPELLTLNSGSVYGSRAHNMKLDRRGSFFCFVSNKLEIMILRKVKLSAAPML